MRELLYGCSTVMTFQGFFCYFYFFIFSFYIFTFIGFYIFSGIFVFGHILIFKENIIFVDIFIFRYLYPGLFFVSFEQISSFALVFPMLTLSRYRPAESTLLGKCPNTT